MSLRDWPDNFWFWLVAAMGEHAAKGSSALELRLKVDSEWQSHHSSVKDWNTGQGYQYRDASTGACSYPPDPFICC